MPIFQQSIKKPTKKATDTLFPIINKRLAGVAQPVLFVNINHGCVNADMPRHLSGFE
jgi:hypothetical protein